LRLGQLLWLHGGIVTIEKAKSLFTPQEVSELQLFTNGGFASLTSEGKLYKQFSRRCIASNNI
jgi:hypothetical protein